MIRAASIDRDKAMAVFRAGLEVKASDLAVACNVHTRTAVWFLLAMERRGVLSRVQPRRNAMHPDFATFRRAT